MKVSEYLAKFLFINKVEFVFELSGGMITHLLDAIHRENNIKIITMHHEQGASFAVDGFSRCSASGIGVAMATSGPGATNLLTGIGSCYFDSVPSIFITGQVNQKEQKGDKKIRQLGFQETDIIRMAEPITKKSYKVNSAQDISQILKEAFKIALSDRPGPVLIDIPMNIQSQDIEVHENDIQLVHKEETQLDLSKSFWDELYSDIKKSTKPIILAGRGAVISKSKSNIEQWSRQLDTPIVSSLLGIGIVDSENEYSAGMIGTYGNRWSNISIGNCDLLIVLGSRLDIRQTGADIESFMSNKKIYHIDIDIYEINNRLKNCISVNMDVSSFLNQALIEIPQDIQFDNSEWKNTIKKLKSEWPDTEELEDIVGINPNNFIKKLAIKSDKSKVYTADVGSHQMWAAQSLRLNRDQVFITSGGMGAMGFSLPAAIGACLATKSPVISISGDGGFQLNIQELQTIVRLNLPIKIVILNNQSLGMIRQFQDSYFDGRHQSTVWGYSAPDFEKIAKAYGIEAYSIQEENEIDLGIEKLWADDLKPFLLQVSIDAKTNVYPKIAFGRPITDMEPFVKAIEMEGT
jgi:acetolactate synthase-1/2/3 large subunit